MITAYTSYLPNLLWGQMPEKKEFRFCRRNLMRVGDSMSKNLDEMIPVPVAAAKNINIVAAKSDKP